MLGIAALRSRAVLRELALGATLLLGASASQATADAVMLSFKWAEAVVGGTTLQRAAMLVPLDPSQPLGPWVQFDTGADDSFVYAWAADELAKSGLLQRSAAGEGRVQLSVRGADSALTVGARVLHHGSKGGAVGTLGANATARSLVVVDYVRRDIFIVRGARYEPAAQCLFSAGRASLLHVIGVRSGIDATVGTASIGPVLFDTGTSAFGLVLFSKEAWTSLPEAGPAGERNVLRTAATFVGDIAIESKVVPGPMCFGGACVSNASVGVVGFDAVPGFQGTVGNRDLATGYAVLDSIGGHAMFSREPLVGRPNDRLKAAVRPR